MKDIDLIKLAVEEYGRGELSAEQAMMNIAIVLSVEPPSKECIEWAKSVAAAQQAVQPDADQKCLNCVYPSGYVRNHYGAKRNSAA